MNTKKLSLIVTLAALSSCKVSTSQSNLKANVGPQAPATPERVKDAVSKAKQQIAMWDLKLTDTELKKNDPSSAAICNDVGNAEMHVKNYFFYNNHVKYVETVRAQIETFYIANLARIVDQSSPAGFNHNTALTDVVNADVKAYFIEKFKSEPTDSYYRAFLKSSICEQTAYRAADPWAIQAGALARTKADAYLRSYDDQLLSTSKEVLAGTFVPTVVGTSMNQTIANAAAPVCVAKRYVLSKTVGADGKNSTWAPLKSSPSATNANFGVLSCGDVTLECDTSATALTTFNATNKTNYKSVAEITNPYKIPVVKQGDYVKVTSVNANSFVSVNNDNSISKGSNAGLGAGMYINSINLREEAVTNGTACATF